MGDARMVSKFGDPKQRVAVCHSLFSNPKEHIMSKSIENFAQALVETVMLAKTDFNTAERAKLAKEGAAMPDGSFPIRNEADLMNAIHAIGRANNPDAVKAHIRARAKALGLESFLQMHGPSFVDHGSMMK